jgi:carbonyl reductase 1
MRVAVVTGTNRGIGLALLLALSRRGYAVVALSRAPPPALPPHSRHVTLDLSSAAATAAAASALADEHPRIDLLINNAAVCDDGEAPAAHARAASLAVNAEAPARLASALAGPLAAAGGVVVNVSSGDGELCFFGSSLREDMVAAAAAADVALALDVLYAAAATAELAGGGGGDRAVHGAQPAYRLSKAALNVVTRVLARVAGTQFSVVAVCPGDVQTRMGCAGAGVDPADAADAIIALAESPALRTGLFYRDGRVIEW